MDFTYLVAFALAILVALICQVAILALRLEARVGLGSVFSVALLLNVALLINWPALFTRADPLQLAALLADVILLPLSSLLGVLAGSLPVIIAVGVFRKVAGLQRTSDRVAS